MSRDADLFLKDILIACDKVTQYLEGYDQALFEGDTRTMDAVIRNLEIMGEAVKRIPSEILRDHPQVDWRGVAGLRDVVTHAYFGVDVDVIWDVAKNRVPELRSTVERILAAGDPPESPG